jgi:hypothetical protein
LYQKGKRYVHRAIFYLNKHKENIIILYQKKDLPYLPYFLARTQEKDRRDMCPEQEGWGVGGGGKEEMRQEWRRL